VKEEFNRYREEEAESQEKETLADKETEKPVDTKLNKDETKDSHKETKSEKVDEKKQSKKEAKTPDVKDSKEYLELEKKCNELQDKYLRMLAETENFKKRTIEERTRERKYMYNDLLMELVNVIDVFDKAVSMKTDDEKLKKYLMGFSMVNMQLKQILSNYSVKKIETLNHPFDPTTENAMDTIVDDSVPADTVVKEIMSGYLYKDRVLRPAHVIVSKKSEKKEDEINPSSNDSKETNEEKIEKK
jgi:molecular chaperone GrpE